jgi:hypothetical protein
MLVSSKDLCRCESQLSPAMAVVRGEAVRAEGAGSGAAYSQAAGKKDAAIPIVQTISLLRFRMLESPGDPSMDGVPV